MDNRLLVLIRNLVLYPGSVDSIYLIFVFPERVKRDGENGINFLECVTLEQEKNNQ